MTFFRTALRASVPALALAGCVTAAAAPQSASSPSIVIPRASEGPVRPITTQDLFAVRDIDTLSVSPDGRLYAIGVRQADAKANAYRSAWFVGRMSGKGDLVYVGNGGEGRLRESPDGRRVGIVVGNPVRWSPDSTRIAYTALVNGEVQLWASDVSSGTQRQVSHNAADVRDFAWSEDGRQLLFSVGETRAALQARDEEGRRRGFLLEEFQYISETIYDATPDRPLSLDLTYWAVHENGQNERPATDAERQEFERMRTFSWGRNHALGATIKDLSGAAAPPVVSSAGKPAWLARDSEAEKGDLPLLRLHAALNADGSKPIRCGHEECTSLMFGKVWWSGDGKRVIFWRKEDTNLVENAFYAWSPRNDRLSRLFREDGDEFRECDLLGERLVCVRETVSRPDHVAAIDIGTGAVEVLADVNPEFANLALGKVERFEWKAPRDEHELGYPSDMFGYIIYPPGFEPGKRYPVFIAPYGAPGFRRGDVGNEHPLFVYAANGILVISSQFPVPLGSMRNSSNRLELTYSAEKRFPHLTMNMESTWNALDAVAARGFVDPQRIGIGGLSHGSFVPLFMLQHYDRLAAVAIAGPGWSEVEYYSPTRTARANATQSWPEAREFWAQIDIAEHVEKIEAPLLVNYPDREFFNDFRLPRRMENADRAFEAYIFPNEEHVKWQPAHRWAIYNRNLDWFRFWLQDIEDTDATKAQQYERWRALRTQQCRNPRSVRDYCAAQITKVATAR